MTVHKREVRMSMENKEKKKAVIKEKPTNERNKQTSESLEESDKAYRKNPIIRFLDRQTTKKSGKGNKGKKRKKKDNKRKGKKRKKKVSKRSGSKASKVAQRSDHLAPDAGYTFTPSFIKSGKSYGTVLKVVNKYGMNHNRPFGWFVGIIPDIKVDNVRAFLVQSDRALSNAEQRDVMTEDVVGSSQTLEHEQDTKRTTKHDRDIRRMRRNDLARATSLDGQENAIIDADIRIMLVSEDPDAIVEQIRLLTTAYEDNMPGLRLVSIGGEQESLLKSVLEPPTGSDNDYTWMSSDFAGNDHMVRRGLTDDDGWALGSMIHSYSAGTATMALDRSFDINDGRNGLICIAAPTNSTINEYDEKLSAPSMWGQLIANNVMANGHKTYHIVLNDFTYHGPKKNLGRGEMQKFSAPASIDEIIQHHNLAHGGINPIQVYGRKESVIQSYNSNLDIIARIFYLLANRNLDRYETGVLSKALNNFYINQRLWIPEADIYPERLRIIDMHNPNDFPTMGSFITELTNSLTGARNSEITTEKDIDTLKSLRTTLENALSQNDQLFNRPSTVPNQLDPTIRQHYFHLGDLSYNSNLLEAQFMNAFNYVTNFADKDDVIMIHGVNRLSVDTLGYLKDTIAMLRRRDVRFAYIFDTIGSNSLAYQNTKMDNTIQYADVFNTESLLYEDFERSFDYTVLGMMTGNELDMYEKLINDGEPLPRNIQRYLTSEGKIRYQVRRSHDGASNILYGDFIV